MIYKTLFVPMSGGARDQPGLAVAFALAKRYGAHVDGIFARLNPADAVPVVGEGMASTLVEQMIDAASRESRQRLAKAHRFFNEAAAAADVPLQADPPPANGASAAFSERLGRDDEIVRWGCGLADIVIVGHRHESEDGLQVTLTLETALLDGGRPVLLAPHTPPAEIGETVAVAWNTNPQSTRALAAAMPMLYGAGQVHVMSVDTRRTDKAAAHDLARYLAWHGIRAEVHTLDRGGEPVGGVLLRRAAEVGADVLVMGAYSHSRVREIILGGVTRYMLAHAGLPILMAH